MGEMIPRIDIDGAKYIQIPASKAQDTDGAIQVGEQWYAPDPDERVLDPMRWIMADYTVLHYLCSGCYGHLRHLFAPGRLYYVECGKCGKDTRGFVSKSFVEQRRSDSIAEAMEVRPMLQEAGIIDSPNKGKSPEDLLREMGY